MFRIFGSLTRRPAMAIAAGMLWYQSVLAQTATVVIQANQPSAHISSNLFGIFFEEINMAGVGGLYGELVRNRSFAPTTPFGWALVTTGTASGSRLTDSSLPLSPSNTVCLKLTKTSGTGSVGVVNNGYFGIPVTNGATYSLGFYARAAAGFSGNLAVTLESSDPTIIYAQTNVTGLTTNWQHFAMPLVATATDPAAILGLRISDDGVVYLDFVSLFPTQTFNNRTNGMRADLANMLAGLKPSFMRFPGGNWVDGSSLDNAYHWELTIGDPANRIPRTNTWGYFVDNGLGYHEYLQLCEDLGATPVLCINAGMDLSQNAVPLNQLGPWVQEALDAIEYANGDTNGAWGSQRAANGHPAPFNLRYIEIGNENHGASYNANYGVFCTSIKSNYPAVRVIANSSGTIPTSAPLDVLDEHLYTSASAIAQAATRYDRYDRNGPKIFVGEYAVAYAIPPSLFPATLQNALGEAAFMTGLERNSDLVEMACYAPLFCNVRAPNWYPDLIYFNGTNVFGTPSYYVQQMFSLNRGDSVLPASISVSGNPLYVSCSRLLSSSQIIVKAVNVNSSAISATFTLNGVASVASTATVIQLTGNAGDQNSLDTPTFVSPATNIIANVSTNFTATLPANSLTIFRLQGAGFSDATNLQCQWLSPLHVGEEAAASVIAQAPGQTINLAGNYGVTYTSMDTNIASVTAEGIVIAAGVGITTITAFYNGMSATQSVEVLPALGKRLLHRYSFNSGTANDSAGSANGVLYNGSGSASIANGQLNLTSSSGDYVDLGPGLISTTNLTMGAVSFEAWISLDPINGAWARVFDFGNGSGASESNYVFLAANNATNGGRAHFAVTDSFGAGNESSLEVNNFLGRTNFHIVAVFNPAPARRFMAIYTNGVLAVSGSTASKHIASISSAFSYLGHSMQSSVPGLSGSLDEFRIYDGELSSNEIAATQVLGPDQLLSTSSPSLGMSLSTSNVVMSWPVAAASFGLMTRTNLSSGQWMPVTSPSPQLVSNRWQVTVPVFGQSRFYRLSL